LKAASSLKQELMNNRLTKIGKEIDILHTKWLMENHEAMDRKKYDDLYHLESVLDIDVAGKDIIVRLDLDVPLSAYTAPSGDVQTMEELQRSQTNQNLSKSAITGKKGSKKDDFVPVKIDEPWRKREITDYTLIKRAANQIKYLQ